MESNEPVRLGVDRLLHSGTSGLASYGQAPRLGLLTHDGARVGLGGTRGQRATSRAALLDAGFNLVRLFSPEHGITANAPDGRPVEDGTDPTTGLPVVSLYGPDLRPASKHLADLDLLLVDVQDVGARFYTYVWTVSYLLEAAEDAGVPVLILDRPNPIGGNLDLAEGPVLDHGQANFLGRWPVPVRHSLTLGEMAKLLCSEMELGTALDVLPMEGWARGMLWKDTGLAFHPPSPGIPTLEAPLLYPALAFLEATSVQVGRGTHRAFQWFGAPWMDAPAIASSVGAMAGPDLKARAEMLVGAGGVGGCPGVAMEVTDPASFRPVSLGLRLLAFLSTFHPHQFRWADYPTAANPSGRDHLPRLLGRRDIASAFFDRPGSIGDDELADWCKAPGWLDRVRPYLLYS
jgi:uncharacterized protein YbbC (DUF1343 family)